MCFVELVKESNRWHESASYQSQFKCYNNDKPTRRQELGERRAYLDNRDPVWSRKLRPFQPSFLCVCEPVSR